MESVQTFGALEYVRAGQGSRVPICDCFSYVKATVNNFLERYEDSSLSCLGRGSKCGNVPEHTSRLVLR